MAPFHKARGIENLQGFRRRRRGSARIEFGACCAHSAKLKVGAPTEMLSEFYDTALRRAIAAFTLARVKGMSRIRVPMAFATALLSAPAAGPWAASPAPRKGCPGRGIRCT